MEGTPQRDAIVAQLKRIYPPASFSSLNKALRHLSTLELVKILKLKILNITNTRGIWFGDDRMDFFEIQNEHELGDRQILSWEFDFQRFFCYSRIMKFNESGGTNNEN